MPEITYRLSMPEPHTHLFHVEMRVDGAEGPVELVMPTWTPGSYMIREFARNVQDFRAEDGEGAPLHWEKTDKLTWRVDAAEGGALRVRYQVYANELSVRSSHLDASHGYVNGASVFFYVAGRMGEPSTVEVEAPEGWRVTTGLKRAEGENVFRAADYDELVDCPMEIGTHQVVEWEQFGRPHRYAIWGRGNYEVNRLVEDTKKIVATTLELFGGDLPYDDYTFILHAVPGQYGGLEHRNSTSLVIDRWGFRGREYERAIVLIAHEFFHVWNGKRIRPEALGPFDYTRENYTRSLWVVEGFTTYYTEVILRRAGIMPPQRYLERLGEGMAMWRTFPGRLKQTLEDASFNAWIHYYRQDENTPNAHVSYYTKGALVCMLLDLKIRQATENARSLDDVLRLLWERYGKTDVGFPEAGIQDAVEEVCGDRLEAFFERYLRTTEEMEFEEYLAIAGLELALPGPMPGPGMGPGAGPGMGPGMGPMPGPPPGGMPGMGPGPMMPGGAPQLSLGVRMKEEGGRPVVGQVLAGSPAYRAGINTGDEIIALDGLRLNRDLPMRLMERKEGDVVELTLFRRDELMTLQVRLERTPPMRSAVRRIPDATPLQAAIREGWAGVAGCSVEIEKPQGRVK